MIIAKVKHLNGTTEFMGPFENTAEANRVALNSEVTIIDTHYLKVPSGTKITFDSK